MLTERVPRTVELVLLTKPGCHLCDDARETIERVRATAHARGFVTELVERNILDDAEMAAKHSEDIPVVFVNGRRHAVWQVDEARLTAAIEKASRRGRFSRG